MATARSTVDAIVRSASGAGDVSARAMFGEYALYLEGKVVALICDDTLFVKPTSAGEAIVGEPVLAPPYRGARPSMVIERTRWEDGEWLARLLQATEAELPKPKPKKRKG